MGILNKANKKLKKVNATDLKVMGFVCQGIGIELRNISQIISRSSGFLRHSWGFLILVITQWMQEDAYG